MPKATPEMAKSGYEALKSMAEERGYGWGFNMVSESDAETAMLLIFDVMLAAAPAGWSPKVAVVRRGARPSAPEEGFDEDPSAA